VQAEAPNGSTRLPDSRLYVLDLDAVPKAESIDFPLPVNSDIQLWTLNFDGTFTPPLAIIFEYDDTILGAGVDENSLAIYKLSAGGIWVLLGGAVDPASNTIAISSSDFGTFVLGVAPAVPMSSPYWIVLTLAGVGLAALRRLHPRGAGK
jgi:hypothetical protein